jgi:membrane protease YdiL (CAAX protease family)
MHSLDSLLKKDYSLMLQKAGLGKQPRNIFLMFLIFIAVFLVSQLVPGLVVGVLTGVFGVIVALRSGSTDLAFLQDPQLMNLLSLFATGLATVIVLLYCKVMEKRSMDSVGFTKKRAFSDYIIGLLVGAGMFAAVIGINAATGAMSFDGMTGNLNYALWGAFFVGFLLQGMSEEVLCRGFLMNSIAGKSSVLAAILINSVGFAALHLANAGIAPLAIVNLALFGIFESILVIRLDSIWMASAIHSIWNFVQGNVFGVLVSGNSFGESVFTFSSAEGMEVLNGGAFGAEGGLGVTAVLVVSIAVCLFAVKNRRDNPFASLQTGQNAEG